MVDRHTRFNARRANDPAYRARKKLYDSARWRRTRERVMRERVFCEDCKAQGRLVCGNEVHHRIDLADGGDPFDDVNLCLLCHDCHSLRTNRGDRLKGCGADGRPLDPHHPWNRTRGG